MRMYPVELPPVRRKKLNFRDHARRSWAMTATLPEWVKTTARANAWRPLVHGATIAPRPLLDVSRYFGQLAISSSQTSAMLSGITPSR